MMSIVSAELVPCLVVKFTVDNRNYLAVSVDAETVAVFRESNAHGICWVQRDVDESIIETAWKLFEHA